MDRHRRLPECRFAAGLSSRCRSGGPLLSPVPAVAREETVFVRTLAGLKAAGGEKTVAHGRARVLRLVTRSDGMGFSMSDVRVAAGIESDLWYKHHWEANYVVAGTLGVEELDGGRSWTLGPGGLYGVGPGDRHRLRALSDVRVVSIFNPPLAGDENHDADGAYPPGGDVPAGPGAMFVRRVEELRAAGREMTVAGDSARSVRMLLKADGLGFTVSDVHLAAGNRNRLWYKHHWEANYVLEGEGVVASLATGEEWAMEPGMVYCVGPDDRHSMHAHSDLHLLSVFCPALLGHELHDADGTLAASGPVPPGPAA